MGHKKETRQASSRISDISVYPLVYPLVYAHRLDTDATMSPSIITRQDFRQAVKWGFLISGLLLTLACLAHTQQPGPHIAGFASVDLYCKFYQYQTSSTVVWCCI